MSLIEEKNQKGEKIQDWMFLVSIHNLIHEPSAYTVEQKYNMIGKIVAMWVENDLTHQVHETFKDA